MSIIENIERIKSAKADLREAIIDKGGTLSEDARLEDYASAVENLTSDNPYAVNFGKDIVENNTYYMNSLQGDIDYYNEVVRSVKSGEKKESDYMNVEDFKLRIVWIPEGWAQPTSFSYYSRLQVLDKPDWVFTKKNGLQYNTAMRYCRVSLAGCTDASNMFRYCGSLVKCDITDTESITTAVNLFQYCPNLREIHLNLPNVTNLTQAFGSGTRLEKAVLTNVDKCSVFTNIFLNCWALVDMRITGWKQGNLPIKNSDDLTAESIANLIDNAVSIADGAVARTLSLSTKILDRWRAAVNNATVYTRDDGTIITCAELASIAANEKGITIA